MAGGVALPASPVASEGENRLWIGPLSALAAVKLLIWAIVGSRYGFHRDELYYLIGGRHLDLGYVDHPPLVPWMARAVESLFGLSLPALRLLPALAGAAIVVLAGVLTARLGGGRRAQLLAATATLLCPFHLMAQNLFQTVPFDQLVWLGLTVLLAGWLRHRDSRRTWLAFGALAGIGLLVKYTLLAFGAATLGAVAIRERRELARPWIYLGGGLTLLLVLPNLYWQARHGWPTLEFLANNNAAERFPPHAFLGLTLIFLGPFALPLVVYAVWFWLSAAGRRFRLLGGIVGLSFVVFLVAQSKPYYAAPLYPVLFAAGAVSLERRSQALSRRWRRLPDLLVMGNLLLVPIFLPVLPPRLYARLHDEFPHPEFGEMFGWHELVETIGEAYRRLPEETRRRVALVTSNYGTASALDLWGGRWGLPAAACGQNSYYYWTRGTHLDPAIAVGFRRETLASVYDEVHQLGVIGNDLGIDNEEAGRPFYLVSGARLDDEALWNELRFFR